MPHVSEIESGSPSVVADPPVPLSHQLSALVTERRERRRREFEQGRRDWPVILRRRANAEDGDARRLLEIERLRHPTAQDEELEDILLADVHDDTTRLNSFAQLSARLKAAEAEHLRFQPAISEAVETYRRVSASPKSEGGDVGRALLTLKDRQQDQERALHEFQRARQEVAQFRVDHRHLFADE
jgi:hypothetical protein